MDTEYHSNQAAGVGDGTASAWRDGDGRPDEEKSLSYTVAKVDPNAFTYEDVVRLLEAIMG